MGRRTRVALALGGGGARGYAHIGVIDELEERGYEIASIAGTSMGALVGGLYAAGRLPQYTEWVRGLTQSQVIRLLDPSLRAPGAIRAEKVLARLTELLAGALIEELPIPFTAVATDLLARKEVWFQEGPLDAAIRASIALPTVITPAVINGRLLVDGGLMNPIPTAPMAASRVDATVAVSLSGEDSQPEGRSPVRESAAPRPADEWLGRFRRSTANVLDRDLIRAVLGRSATRNRGLPEPRASTSEEALERAVEPAAPDIRMLDVVDLSLDAMQSLVTRYRLAAYPPDLLITIPKTACRTLDFHRANDMIPLGRQATADALDHSETFPPGLAQN